MRWARRLKPLLGLACLWFVADIALAGEPTAAERLVEELGRLKSLEATFQQIMADTHGIVTERTHGRVLAERPGRFRWITDPPFAQELVSDGETLWFYDPDLEQVTVRPVDEQLMQTPALLLSGDAEQVVREFDVSLAVDRDDYREFVLTPRSEDAIFETLVLAFDATQPTILEIVDGLGEKTRIFFGDFTANPSVETERFRFEIPPGVDVIRDG
jgi:outer membrane lipoprotein carrier protein